LITYLHWVSHSHRFTIFSSPLRNQHSSSSSWLSIYGMRGVHPSSRSECQPQPYPTVTSLPFFQLPPILLTPTFSPRVGQGLPPLYKSAVPSPTRHSPPVMGRGPGRRRYRRHEAHLNRWRRRLTLHADPSSSSPHSSSTPRSKPTARSGRGHARLCNCQRSPSPRLCRVCLVRSSVLGLYCAVSYGVWRNE